jgi:hypothetical protein
MATQPPEPRAKPQAFSENSCTRADNVIARLAGLGPSAADPDDATRCADKLDALDRTALHDAIVGAVPLSRDSSR